MKNRKTANSANLIFIGDRADRDPVRTVRLQGGRLIVRLPADQSKPFYCAFAREVARALPMLYKLFD